MYLPKRLTTDPTLIEGDTVVCTLGCLDRDGHAGERGEIIGFARLSSYHPREARVRFADGSAAWFLAASLERASHN